MSAETVPTGGREESTWRAVGTVLRLTRIENHITFFQLVLGYAVAKQFRLTASDALTLVEVLASLALLLYSGLYALNDVADADVDAKNSIKRTRPIPAGRIQASRARLIAVVLMVSGLVSAWAIPAPRIFIVAVAFLVSNIFYTSVTKHVRVLDILTNAVTHPLRLLSGFLVAGGTPSIRLLVIWYLGAVNIALFRRVKELLQGDTAGRPVLRTYTVPGLLRWYWITVPLIATLSATSDRLSLLAGVGWLAYTLLVVGGSFKFPLVRRTVEFLWR